MPNAVTLPQHFMAHGYHAVGSGKIYHGRYPDPPSWHDYLKKTGDPKPTKAVLADPQSRAGGVVWGVLDVPDDAMDDHSVVNWAIQQLNQPRKKPLFLACGLYRPHLPWYVPQEYFDMFPLDELVGFLWAALDPQETKAA